MPTLRPDDRRLSAALGYLAFLLIGWSGLLIPSLVRSIEADLHQDDAGIGFLYFLYAVAYATGSLGGGAATERRGRRLVLSAAAGLHALGLAIFGLVSGWSVFLLAAIPAGLGAGAIDGGVNGLFLDLFPVGRGRALNSLHVFFSIGALVSPLAVGLLVDAGVPWQSIILMTAVAALPLAIGLAVMRLPHGRRRVAEEAEPATARPIVFQWPLLALAVAIAAYVASEVGVSNWLVRFLEPAPLVVATTSLSLFWGGLTVGRIVSARIADRFDHLQFAMSAALIAAAALVGAVVVPFLPASIALFTLVGFASGPIFPTIIAVGGERFPDRSAAVSGFLTGSAVVGAVLYPPVMGFISVTIGLPAAMLGTALLCFACSGALLAARGRTRTASAIV
ncbi:MAG TPA: MFS transporter [Candidatus Limnocylindrales bacterium]